MQINPGKHRPQPATRSLALLLQGWEQATLPSSSFTFIPVSTSLLIVRFWARGGRQGRQWERKGESLTTWELKQLWKKREGMTHDPLAGVDRKLQGSQDEEPVTQGHSATRLVEALFLETCFPQPVRGQTDGYKHRVAITEEELGERKRCQEGGGGLRISSPSAGQVSLTWEGPPCSSFPPRAPASERTRLGLKSNMPSPVRFQFPSPECTVLSGGVGTMERTLLALGSWRGQMDLYSLQSRLRMGLGLARVRAG